MAERHLHLRLLQQLLLLAGVDLPHERLALRRDVHAAPVLAPHQRRQPPPLLFFLLLLRKRGSVLACPCIGGL